MEKSYKMQQTNKVEFEFTKKDHQQKNVPNLFPGLDKISIVYFVAFMGLTYLAALLFSIYSF